MRMHLHVGAEREHMGALVQTAARLPGVVAVHRDGDSWEEWGEPIDRPQYEGREHLVVEVSDALEPLLWAVRTARALERTRLLIRSRDSHAILWTISDAEEWEKDILADTGVAALAGAL